MVKLNAVGAARMTLDQRRFRTQPGTWCMQVELPATATSTRGLSSRTCFRYRPPITIGWAGDITLGSSYGQPPANGQRMFAGVRSLLKTPDLMIGNYEGTLSTGGTPRCGGGGLCYLFQAPPKRGAALKDAGFDVINLANNHALDMGTRARGQMARSLRRRNIGVAGMPGTFTVRQVADTRVAVVGFSPYPGTDSLRDLPKMRRLIRRARTRADIVVVCVHVGLEGAAGAHVPRGSDYGTNTRHALHAAIDAGADVVFGSGPHVVRGIQRYRGTYIVYSSGNFAGWHNFGLSRLTAQSGVVDVTFGYRGTTSGGVWHPVHLKRPGVPVRDRSGAVIRRVRELSRSDFGSSRVRIARDGAFH